MAKDDPLGKHMGNLWKLRRAALKPIRTACWRLLGNKGEHRRDNGSALEGRKSISSIKVVGVRKVSVLVISV